MKRRSRAGGKASKARGREALKTKRRDTSKNVPPSAPVQAAEVARLTRELNEAREEQTATSDVLRVISASGGELEPVFQAMLENATRLCEAKFGTLYFREADGFRAVAMHGAPPAYLKATLRSVFQATPTTALGRVVQTKQAVHIEDVTADRAYLERDPIRVSAVELGGVRTVLGVPMLKDNEVIGAIGIYREVVRPFTDRHIGLVTNFAAHAVIAIENARLLNELRQRKTELTEALEQQTGTSEVLQVVSRSPGDLQPVFVSMLENATRICDAKFGSIARWEGQALHFVATHNLPPAFAEFRLRSSYRPDLENPLNLMLTAKAVLHIADLAAERAYIERRDPGMVAAVELGGAHTAIAVPMVKENELIGAFLLYRQEVCPFADKQIELVQNFAAQAVIAIENARLLNELRQRTADLTEALEQQTATSEVLQIISSSPGDLEPVFAAMLENAARICDASFGNIFSWDGHALLLIATHNTPPAFAEYRRRQPLPLKPNLPFARGRM